MGNINYRHFTLGVEEEYMVVDPQTRELKSHEQKIVHEGQKIIKDKTSFLRIRGCYIDEFRIAKAKKFLNLNYK
jgi:hypothetical protein